MSNLQSFCAQCCGDVKVFKDSSGLNYEDVILPFILVITETTNTVFIGQELYENIKITEFIFTTFKQK